MQITWRMLTLAALSFLTVACSYTPRRATQKPHGVLDAYSNKNNLTEELESELRDVSTDFFLPIPDNRYAWERAQLFFKEHTSQSTFSAGRRDSISLSNSAVRDPVMFQVEKIGSVNGSRFKLSCAQGTAQLSPDELSIQCKNMARFVHFGILEKSLLPQ